MHNAFINIHVSINICVDYIHAYFNKLNIFCNCYHIYHNCDIMISDKNTTNSWLLHDINKPWLANSSVSMTSFCGLDAMTNTSINWPKLRRISVRNIGKLRNLLNVLIVYVFCFFFSYFCYFFNMRVTQTVIYMHVYLKFKITMLIIIYCVPDDCLSLLKHKKVCPIMSNEHLKSNLQYAYMLLM